MYQNTQELNKYIRGWVSYFEIQEFKTLFGATLFFNKWMRKYIVT